MDVYERLGTLRNGDSCFVDLHQTLLLGDHFGESPNMVLVEALINAQRRGVVIVLWTAGTWRETLHGVNLLEKHGLVFDDVITGVVKPTLIIDDISVTP